MNKNAGRARTRREIVSFIGAGLLGALVLIVAVRMSERKRDAEIADPDALAQVGKNSFNVMQEYQQFDKDVLTLTPPNSIDCGVASQVLHLEGGDLSNQRSRIPVDSCAVAALKAHKPFQASYYYSDSSSATERKLIGTAAGHIYFLERHSSSDNSGSWKSLDKHPVIIKVAGRERISTAGSLVE
jgi:hypothetical protein